MLSTLLKLVNNQQGDPPHEAHLIEPLEPRVYLSVTLDAGVLTVTGSPGNDQITIKPGDADGEVVVQGDPDGDSGVYTGVEAITVDGGEGNDRLRVRNNITDTAGDPLGVTLIGGDGNDRLTGGNGDDTLLGGDGRDNIRGKDGDDNIQGNAGRDHIRGGRGNDTLSGGEDEDRINGGRGDDIISGDAGNDRLNGQTGTDTVTYESSPAGVVVNLARGRATEDGFGTRDRRVVRFENLNGSNFPDDLAGNKRPNTIDGRNAQDTIAGRPNDTVLNEATIDDDPPILTAQLTNDTGPDPTDTLTSDPTIDGTAVDATGVALLSLTIPELGLSQVDATTGLDPDTGLFVLTRDLIESLTGAPLGDGPLTVGLEAIDAFDNTSDPVEIAFTLDVTAPVIDVALTSDTGLSQSDGITSDPDITGTVTDFTGVQELLLWREGDPQERRLDVTPLLTPGGTLPLSPAFIVGTGLLTDAPPLAAEAQPNRFFTQANDLSGSFEFIGGNSFQTTVTGRMDLGDEGFGPDWDFFKIPALPGDTVTAVLEGDLPESSLRLVKDDVSNHFAVDAGMGSSRMIEFDDFDPFIDYFLAVTSAGQPGDYTLTVTRSITQPQLGFPDGEHTFLLQASDVFGHVSEEFDLSLTLDTIFDEPTLRLSPAQDTGVVGDRQTAFNLVTLRGTAEPNAQVQLSPSPGLIDDFESHISSVIGSSATSTPWRRFGPATSSGILTSPSFDEDFSGNFTGRYSLRWPSGFGFGRSFASARYVFSAPADVSDNTLASVKIRSTRFTTNTHVRLSISNETTTYHSTAILPLTNDVQTLDFRLLEEDMFLAEGTDSFDQVVTNATNVGFTFQSLQDFYTETILFDDFMLSSADPALFDPVMTTAGPDGRFSLTDVPLSPGTNGLTVQVTDAAGNQGQASVHLIRHRRAFAFIHAALANDTGPGDSDTFTTDPSITGLVAGFNGVTMFQIAIDDPAMLNPIDILADLQPDGVFQLDSDRLEQLNGGPLALGEHTLHFRAGNDTQSLDDQLDFVLVAVDPLQVAELTAADAAPFDNFGRAVAIHEGVALVGAPDDDSAGASTGSAYLYDLSTPSGPQQIAKLIAEDASSHTFFGSAVALNQTLALVGAFAEDEIGLNTGAAYLYDINTGDQIVKITVTDATDFANFGSAVALNGNLALIGAPMDNIAGFGSGSAYLFDVSNPATPVEITKLLPDDPESFDHFGGSVALSGNTAIVSARGDSDAGSSSGSAYLFDTTTGDQLFKLTADDAAGNDRFGGSVAVSGNTAIVGASGDDDDGSQSGSAYLFDVSTGDQLAKLTAPDAASFDTFGVAVAISGNVAVVGSNGDDDAGSSSGSAYLFDISDPSNPVSMGKLTAADANGSDQFGTSVAVTTDTVIVGAIVGEAQVDQSGSAYLFNLS